jgi:hypothetical protein
MYCRVAAAQSRKYAVEQEALSVKVVHEQSALAAEEMGRRLIECRLHPQIRE